MTKQKTKILTYFILAVLLFALGQVANKMFDIQFIQKEDIQTIQHLVNQNQLQLITSLDNLEKLNISDKDSIWYVMDSLSSTGNYYYLYHDSTVIAWSSSKIQIDGFHPEPNTSTLEKFPNGWYLASSRKEGDYLWLALSLVKEEYSYQNKFLSNHFANHQSLNYLPDIILDEKSEASYHINDANGEFLFALQFDPQDKHLPKINILVFLVNILALLLLLIAGEKILIKYNSLKNSNYLFIGAIIYLFLIYLLFINWSIPDAFFHTSLFSPSTFAVSDWLPSLGSLEVFGILMLFWGLWFFKYFKKPIALEKLNSDRKAYYLTIFISIFMLLIYFLFINDLIYMLVRNSSQASIFFNIDDFNQIYLLKILILVQLFMAFSFVYEKIISYFRYHLSYIGFLIISCISYGIIWSLSDLLHYDIHPSSLAFFLFLGGILFTAKRNLHNKLKYNTFILITFVISAYNVFILYTYNVSKEAKNRELLIENLSFRLLREADPVAEMYLTEIETRLMNDKDLDALLHQKQIDEEQIIDHLKKNYFYGYWQRYDIQVTTCWPEVDLIMPNNSENTNCYDYFQNIVNQYGQLIPSSNHFYFLDNDNGQVSYLGKICFFETDPMYETTMFFEINSKPTFSGLGYPELLMTEQEQINVSNLKNYSYANYIDDKLVKQSGPFKYPSENTIFRSPVEKKSFITEKHMSHLTYLPTPNTTIVLSRQNIRFVHIMMAFSSYFILFFLLTTFILIFNKIKKNRYQFSFSIQERIQITFVGLMMIILLIMGISSVYYSIYQFKQKNDQMLSQRIKSVLQEMEQKIISEPKLDIEMQEYLQYLLQKFSNVFYSDINLYNLNGRLLATSRPELYQKGLTGKMMDPDAFIQLTKNKTIEYIHQETIGSLKYTSAYIPIYNFEHKVLAYLNLPYFIGINELKTEISSLIVAVINAYLLFVLFAIGLAVIISRRITRPLILIQDRLAQIKLGQPNKKIGYKGDDEIGSLVKEYNRMVEELSASAEKLAQSEREMAWREMAKQVAHEIKNPLTPMKLSVQYLLKAWDEKQDFDSYLHRVSKTLIEQIDQLHVIANEFSNFAKMPQAHRQKVDLIKKLKNVISLFEQSENNIDFRLSIADENIFVFADSDQLISVFNNIIKNAVQSIPKGRKGCISISVEKTSTTVQLMFADNGRGIDETIKKKIFMPNFTTKSSGMGLGLSIVKNIINNSGGEIRFETTPNIGTTFFINLPLYNV